MSIATPEAPARPDLEILEALDFEPDIPCEHSNHGKVPWHDGPAAHLVGPNGPCGNCGRPTKPTPFALCASAWAYWGSRGVLCIGCKKGRPREELVKILGSVK